MSVAESGESKGLWRTFLGPAPRMFSIAAGVVFLLLYMVGALSSVAAFSGFAAFACLAYGLDWLTRENEHDAALRDLQQIAPVTAPDLSKDALLDVLPNPILILDETGRVLLNNSAASALVGSAATGKHITTLLRSAPLTAAIEDVLQGAAACSVEFRQPVPVERTYRAFVAPVMSDRLPVGLEQRFVVVLLHDLTDARRLETMRVDFVANASHELKTPLASLSGFIDTLRGHAKDDEAARARFLDIMAEQAGRMRRLIENLLSLSRIELHEHVRPDARVDFAGVARDVAEALMPLAAAHDMEVVVKAPAGLPQVRGDRDELAQVVQNLADNALRYGRTGKKIEIELAPDSKAGRPMVRLSVRDFGAGISREHLPRLTERFYRVENTTPQAKGGTGLGLAIVKHIVSRHQGTLQIESEPDKGSVFTVFIPAAEAE